MKKRRTDRHMVRLIISIGKWTHSSKHESKEQAMDFIDKYIDNLIKDDKVGYIQLNPPLFKMDNHMEVFINGKSRIGFTIETIN